MLTNKKQRTSHRRMLLMALGLTFALSVIVAQLVRFQVMRHAELSQKASGQRRREREVRQERGYIADIHGHILALDVVQWDISASPPLVSDPEELADRLADQLDMPKDKILTLLVSDVPWVPIARHVDQQVGEAVADLQASGLTCTPRPLRVYPESGLAAHAIGIVNDTGDGFYGVEGYHNQLLKGVAGKEQIEQDPGGEAIPIPSEFRTPPKAGSNLILTLDRNIQYIAEEELEKALSEYGAESGTVIIMNPRTGALLAIANNPSYDPNEFAGTDPQLLADPSVSSMWEPGSIFKIITWAAGLDSGIISPHTSFYDNGHMEVGGRVIRNWDREAYGRVTMLDGLVHSLNTVAAFISTSMGKDRFYTYLRRFGFDTLTGADLASEGPGMMKRPGDSNWFPSELGTNSFGQGIAVTPMQMVTAAAAVANRGVLMKPYIVHQFITTDQNGERTVQVEPMIIRHAISQQSAKTLTDMLVEVIERGATKAQVPGYQVAGKTGTAQVPTAYGYHPSETIASFVGWAPAYDPQIIILVKLNKPTASQWGSQTAAPTFRAIAERLLVYLQIPPDEVRLAQH